MSRLSHMVDEAGIAADGLLPADAMAVSFPLGGIGAGSVGLSTSGRLVDWEIFNRPNKNSFNGFSFFGVRLEQGGEVIHAKVLNGDLSGQYSGTGETNFRGFGFGVNREAIAGFPHYSRTVFQGRFPFAEILFDETESPCDVRLRAYSPFIPHNDKDSSLPLAVFSFEVKNRTGRAVEASVVANLTNPFPVGSVNEFFNAEQYAGIRLATSEYDEDDARFGELCITTDGESTSYQEYWYRGEWFDNLTVFWNDFTTPGPFENRHYEIRRQRGKIATYNYLDVCLLSSQKHLEPDETGRFNFALVWRFPNFENYWNPGNLQNGEPAPKWKNYYATVFGNARQVADYYWNNSERLESESRGFEEALFGSSLPHEVIDAIAGNLAIMKSPTCIRLTDGTLYGFEGCHATAGCCEGSCTHVWNYEQAFAYLFPNLARSMREIEYKYSLYPNGKMSFRLLLPPERTLHETSMNAGPGRAAADGQMGTVLRTYREWRACGDTRWLRAIWPAVKRSLEYAWEATNEDWWDKDRDGVMEGVQHHTLDVEIYGPNSYITGLYLAALVAAEEMAKAVGEHESAQGYRDLWEKGHKWVEENLYNGEYFHQSIDLHDERFPVDPELGEIKYQIGTGCHVDQVLGQWHAHMLGLGYVLDPRKVRSAIRSVFENNFISMRDHANANRIYALNDEKGLVICTWPRGNAPKVPVPYANECMNGFEYQAASHLIYEGFVDEGMSVVKALRERYDGFRRNPWNEIECGSNYARSLASYSLLLALSGFEYDMRVGHIGFSPRVSSQSFSCFWSVGEGWGMFKCDGGGLRMDIRGGRLHLTSFGSEQLESQVANDVMFNEEPVAFHQDGRLVLMENPLLLQRGDALSIRL